MKTSKVRIIGGKWRGRALEFPVSVKQLRPTPGQVRETLFNWLATDIRDARCLDLYAGSGALGAEAISRGAADVVFVDADRQSARLLEKNLRRLGSQSKVYMMDARRFVRQIEGKWDIIFLDPPYRHNMLPEILDLLVQYDRLADGALVYIEAERELADIPLPQGWQRARQKLAGQVAYSLVQTGHRESP